MNQQTGGNLFQRWKDYEKQRRINFARVMQERRRIKAGDKIGNA